MNRRVMDGAVCVAGATIALILSGCAATSTSTTTAILETTTTSTLSSTHPEERALAQYWVAETARGFRLYREFIRLKITPDPITAALRALFVNRPGDADYMSLWPNDTTINGVEVAGNVATIDLTFGELNVGAQGEALAIAQIVWTATAADPSILRISFTVDGKKVESLAGHVDASKPFTRAPAYEVVAPVWITSPVEGSQVSAQGFTLGGLASTFEANVVWKVLQGGKVIRQGFTTAAGAAPTWTPWSATIDGLEPGEYQVAAMEFSAMDGSLVAQDTKNVTLK